MSMSSVSPHAWWHLCIACCLWLGARKTCDRGLRVKWSEAGRDWINRWASHLIHLLSHLVLLACLYIPENTTSTLAKTSLVCLYLHTLLVISNKQTLQPHSSSLIRAYNPDEEKKKIFKKKLSSFFFFSILWSADESYRNTHPKRIQRR
jgi:hypothetical protein